MNKIAFFDFDGTITTKDSLAEFIKYAVGGSAYYVGLLKLSPILAVYKFKLIPNHIAKERLIASFFQGWSQERFGRLAEKYSLEEVDKITRPKAIEKIRWHQEQGHRIVIVSASMECWLQAWCKKNGCDLLSTKLEMEDGVLTGKFAAPNCYGIEKANRVKEAYNLSSYDYIYAYGDSRGDKELLVLADEGHYKPFRA